MKKTAILLAVAAFMAGGAMAQGKKQAAPAAAPATQAAAPAASGTMNMKDIEGKWKIDHVDVDIKGTDGEVTKETQPGSDEDFMEFAKGTMTSYISGMSENKVYTLSGGAVTTKGEGITDTYKIVSLTKTSCVLSQKVDDDSGTGTRVIHLKK